MSNVEAHWHVNLLVDCPECEEIIDLMDNDSFTDGTHSYVLESQNNIPVECPECGYKFNVDLVW